MFSTPERRCNGHSSFSSLCMYVGQSVGAMRAEGFCCPSWASSRTPGASSWLLRAPRNLHHFCLATDEQMQKKVGVSTENPGTFWRLLLVSGKSIQNVPAVLAGVVPVAVCGHRQLQNMLETFHVSRETPSNYTFRGCWIVGILELPAGFCGPPGICAISVWQPTNRCKKEARGSTEHPRIFWGKVHSTTEAFRGCCRLDGC